MGREVPDQMLMVYDLRTIYTIIISVFLSSDRGSGRRPSKNEEARKRRVAI